MRHTVYKDHWLSVLHTVVADPMKRSIYYSEILEMPHGRVTHVLIGLKQEGYIAYYEYKHTNQYGDQPTQRHYYPLEKGNAIIKMVYAPKN